MPTQITLEQLKHSLHVYQLKNNGKQVQPHELSDFIDESARLSKKRSQHAKNKRARRLFGH